MQSAIDEMIAGSYLGSCAWAGEGRWKFSGYYCLVAAVVVFALAKLGY